MRLDDRHEVIGIGNLDIPPFVDRIVEKYRALALTRPALARLIERWAEERVWAKL